jgi:hypothetical protein
MTQAPIITESADAGQFAASLKCSLPRFRKLQAKGKIPAPDVYAKNKRAVTHRWFPETIESAVAANPLLVLQAKERAQ